MRDRLGFLLLVAPIIVLGAVESEAVNVRHPLDPAPERPLAVDLNLTLGIRSDAVLEP